MKKYLLSLALLCSTYTVEAQDNLVINEVMAANVDYVLDPSINYGSWIELYNPTKKQISTKGLYVTDDINDLKKSPIYYDEEIGAGGFSVIWFDHWDGVFSPGQMKFKLDYDGGTIYVTDGSKVICSQEYPKAIGRVSYARTTDGGNDWAWTANATPGNTNSLSTFVGSAEKQLSAPVFSTEGRVFNDPFKLQITSPEGGEIYYTTSLDWSCPTPNPKNGESRRVGNNESIDIPQRTVVIRARAYKDGYLPSEVVTHTYFYRDVEYVFPIISVATDYQNIYSDERGLFQGSNSWWWDEELCPNGRPGNGQSSNCNWNCDWDRPVNFEYITADGEYALNQEVDMSMCGGWTRARTPHSFKLKAGKYYMGQNSLNYQFFPEKPNLKHKVLQIRNGGNDTSCRFKDAAIQKIVRSSGLRINTQSWQPVHVFINGFYYSVLNMREPSNKHFAYSNYGYDTDSIDQFEISPDSGYVQKVGTPEKFDEWFELSQNAADSATYAQICELVDIEEYINYWAVETFLCPSDWGRNNVKGFRNRKDGKFHFVLFDTDSAFENTGSPFAFINERKNFTSDLLYGIGGVTPWETGDYKKEENKFVTTFVNMLNNEDFRKKFVNSLCVISGSVFDPTRSEAIIDEMQTYMNKGMELTGESCSNTATSLKGQISATHQNNIISNMKNYAPLGLKSTGTYTVNLNSNIEEGELFINDVKVPTGEFLGEVYKPVTLRAAAPAGYKFLGWYTIAGGTLYSTDLEIEVSEITPRYTAKWEKMTDEEMLANGFNPSPVVINEVSASNEIYVNDLFKKADWIELYNTSNEDVNIAGLYLTDNLDKPQKYQIPTEDVNLNTIIPAHGYKIVWCDKKEAVGDAIHASFKLEADSGSVALLNYDGDNLVYSDTVQYEYHDGTHSYGRYPDGGMNGYLMPKPTPGASNVCGTDVIDFIARQRVVVVTEEETDVKAITAENGTITIAYVGGGIVNIKSENGNISTIRVISSSGALVKETAADEPFVTINLSDLPQGLYIVTVNNVAGNFASLKFMR